MTTIAFDSEPSGLKLRANLANLAIYVFILIFAAQVIIDAAALSRLEIGISPGAGDLIAVAGLLAYTVSAVFIGMWIYRAHASLSAAGLEGLEFSPGWSVGWFFVPIMSLFKPFQAMKELWNASCYASDHLNEDAPSLLTGWWATFLLGNFLANFGARIGNANGVTMLSAVVMITSAVLLLQIIKRVGEAQRTLNMAGTFA